MSLESSIYTYLKSKTAITNIVGSGDNARIYPYKRPQGSALPAIVWTVISDVMSHNLDGSDGTAKARVQFTLVHTDYLALVNLREQLRLVLDGYSHSLGDFGDIFLFSCLQDDYSGSYMVPMDAADAGAFAIGCDYFFHYRVSIPTFIDASFLPSDISGLLYWVRPEGLTGLNDGDPITTWLDSSGNGYTTTASGLRCPTYKEDIINGHAVARFSGNQRLTTSLRDSLGDSTYFIVYRN